MIVNCQKRTFAPPASGKLRLHSAGIFLEFLHSARLQRGRKLRQNGPERGQKDEER
jgi:hypothetical protein